MGHLSWSRMSPLPNAKTLEVDSQSAMSTRSTMTLHASSCAVLWLDGSTGLSTAVVSSATSPCLHQECSFWAAAQSKRDQRLPRAERHFHALHEEHCNQFLNESSSARTWSSKKYESEVGLEEVSGDVREQHQPEDNF